MRRLKDLPITPTRTRLSASGRPIGVDRKAGILRGYVMAKAGPFKTPGRGEFDRLGLQKIVQLTNAAPKGLKSRFTHPTESDDGLGKHLGRAVNARIDGDLVRGDLKFDPTAFETPSGNLAKYVMDLAESDSDALSSSLVLSYDEILRRDPKGRLLTAPDGEPLPPVWMPTKIMASDIVDTGDACDGLLSAEAIEALPDSELWRGVALLDSAFKGQTRQVIAARCTAWLSRYLTWKFGELQATEDIAGPACPLCHGATTEANRTAHCANCKHSFLYASPAVPFDPGSGDTIKPPTPILDTYRERLRAIQMKAMRK